MRNFLPIAFAALLAFACSSANAGGTAYILAGHTTKLSAADAGAMRGKSIAVVPPGDSPIFQFYDFGPASYAEIDVLVGRLGGAREAPSGAPGEPVRWRFPAPHLDPAPQVAEDIRAALQGTHAMSATPPTGATTADYEVSALPMLWQVMPLFGRIRLTYTVSMQVRDRRDGKVVAGAICTYNNMAAAKALSEYFDADMPSLHRDLVEARNQCVRKFVAKALKAG